MHVSCCILLIIVASPAQTDPIFKHEKSILVLDSFSSQMIWAQQFRKGFEEAIKTSGASVSHHWEFLDSLKFGSHLSTDSLAKFLSEKYSDIELDYIIAHGTSAAQYLARNPALFESVPIIFLTGSDAEATKAAQTREKSISIAMSGEINASLDYVISQHHPRKVFVLGETKTDYVRNHLAELKREQSPVRESVEIEYLVDLPIESIEKSLAAAKKGDAAFHVAILRDHEGQRIQTQDYIYDLAENASIPIFSYWTTWVNNAIPAIIGGLVLDPEQVGDAIARNLVDHLVDDKPIDSKKIKEATTQPIYDHRQMQRFGITIDEVPPNAVILNRDVGVFEGNMQFIVGVLTTLGLVGLWRFALRRQVAAQTRHLQEENQELSIISNTDALTNLPNRRKLDEMIKHECARSGRMKQALAVALIDVDHFKKYNDQYGHQQGDACLQKVAATIQMCCNRAGDNCARFGGEEFALISVGNDRARAELQLNKLRQKIENLGITHSGNETGFVTVSAGIAVIQGSYPYDPEQLIKEADKALYEAKRAGRNRVVSVVVRAGPDVAFQ